MRLPKIILLIVAATLVKLVTSCFIFDCKCPSPMLVDMAFNRITIQTIDNTGLYISNYPTKRNTLPAKAVAFNIELKDTINYETYPEWAKSKVSKPAMSGFNTAMALAPCYCNITDFLPKKKLQSLSVFTRYAINNTLVPGDDIAHLFVGRYNNMLDAGNLYSTMDELINYHKNIEAYDEPITSFAIYLKGEVQNDSLQLDIQINFDDNSCISTTTPTIYLTHNQP